MRRSLCRGFVTLGAFAAWYGCAVGLMTILMGSQSSDIDGPISLRSRVFWTAVGAGIVTLSVAVFLCILWLAFRRPATTDSPETNTTY